MRDIKHVKELRKEFTKAIYIANLQRQDRLEISSRLQFLLSVNGLRQSYTTIVLGNTSSGKSTLVRSIIADILENNDTTHISCFLSEETSSEYRLELFKAFKTVDFADRMKFYSEQDCQDDDEKMLMLYNAFADSSEVLIFDNITTSALYASKTPQDQTAFSNLLKTATKRTNKALVCVAHTNNVEKNGMKLINTGDVRGSKNISNIAEFFFINHQFSCGESLLNYVQIEKHRGQSPDNSIFQLGYKKSRNLYTSDFPVSFLQFKEIYKTRNKL